MPTPSHYNNSIPCHKAMSSMVETFPIVKMLEQYGVASVVMQAFWWLQTFKYVWRLWHKDTPVQNARKAISCLEFIIEAQESK